MPVSQEEIRSLPYVQEAEARGFISFKDDRVTYHLKTERSYDWNDPEERVRCHAIAFLIVERSYPPSQMRTEVPVPRRVPNDFADVVVFSDRQCKSPYLVAETKSDGQGDTDRLQGVEQAIGNAHSLRADLAFYDEWSTSSLFDTSGAFPAMERELNRRGSRDRIPHQFATKAIEYRFIAGEPANDVRATSPDRLENKVRRTHSIIWSGGKRDPLTSFDEWSKLLFAKVHDERNTPNGMPRQFQIGPGETSTAVANRVHGLFAAAADQDKTIFPEGTRIVLSDQKIADVVAALQDISIVATDVDTIGAAFESFFGSVFRGELGQYFTMRQICRFTVAALDIDHESFVIDPTAGSGGFLLETLLQVWHRIDSLFTGQTEIERKRYDFAMHRVFGIEIHAILARILKINLLLHHDGHTNIEADRSCLDVEFRNQHLADGLWRGKFDRIVGNPPFGDTVKQGDVDLLGANSLDVFQVAKGRTHVPSEHVILERSIDMLDAGGRLGFVLPDGLFNNPGDQSNCPRVRRFLASSGAIEGIISLPDYAFRKSGAQNKTSILLFRKFTSPEAARWSAAYREAVDQQDELDEDAAISSALQVLDYPVFLAEAKWIGYTPSGAPSAQNDLYAQAKDGRLHNSQDGRILGELARFRTDPASYDGQAEPVCASMSISEMWEAHDSHRLDPKYHLFKIEEQHSGHEGWVRRPAGELMQRRLDRSRPEESPDDSVVVLTIQQSGELKKREPGKGQAPPEWVGMYFEDMPTKWYSAQAGDVVFSRIDLWKGSISVVTPEFDGALVSGEFPVYEVTADDLDPDFLSALLRSRYYQRAFRAITTGHSNRRRTQEEDFEALEIMYPPDTQEQRRLISDVLEAKAALRKARQAVGRTLDAFSKHVDAEPGDHSA